MASAYRKRIKEEQDLSRPEDSHRQKQARLMEFEVGMAFDKAENAGNENLPEFFSLSNEYSMFLKDSWRWEDSLGFEIRSNIADIRKQTDILDCLHDPAIDNNTEEEIAEQQKLQLEEEDCLRGSLFDATDDLLWRSLSPLPSTENLFPLDSMGSHDCISLLQDESIVEGAASCFRIWERNDDQKGEKNHADDISFVYESGISDWTWGAPANQSQFSESVEFESSLLAR